MPMGASPQRACRASPAPNVGFCYERSQHAAALGRASLVGAGREHAEQAKGQEEPAGQGHEQRPVAPPAIVRPYDGQSGNEHQRTRQVDGGPNLQIVEVRCTSGNSARTICTIVGPARAAMFRALDVETSGAIRSAYVSVELRGHQVECARIAHESTLPAFAPTHVGRRVSGEPPRRGPPPG